MKGDSNLRRQAEEAIAAGDKARAATLLSMILKACPEDADVRLKRGQLWSEMGEFGPALADFAEVARMNPRSALPWIYRAGVYRKADQLDRAEADLSKAIELWPDSIEGRLWRAHVRMELRDWPGAIEDCQAVLARNPANKEARERLLTARILGKDPEVGKPKRRRHMGAWWHTGGDPEATAKKAQVQVAPITARLEIAGGNSIRARLDLTFIQSAADKSTTHPRHDGCAFVDVDGPSGMR